MVSPVCSENTQTQYVHHAEYDAPFVSEEVTIASEEQQTSHCQFTNSSTKHDSPEQKNQSIVEPLVALGNGDEVNKDNKMESNAKSKESTSMDGDVFNGAETDLFKWSQTQNDVDLKDKDIPEHSQLISLSTSFRSYLPFSAFVSHELSLHYFCFLEF